MNIIKVLIPFTITGLLAGCGLPSSSGNLDTQVQTAIAQTAQAETAFQVAVDQAVEATIVAMPPTPTALPAVDPYSLTEEELAALIDASCEEAATASSEAQTVTSQAASDGAYTEEEVYDTITYVYDAEAAITYAEELIDLYFDLYGAYASEALDILYAVESDLNELANAMMEIGTILAQGAETASAAFEQINAMFVTAQAKADETRAKATEFKEKLPAVLQEREDKFADLAPTEVASDRDGALIQVYSYLDSVKSALADRKVSPDELGQIAQLATNAQAGINQGGGPLLKKYGANIDGITRNLSRGAWPTVQRELGSFEASLPSRPARR
jgi:hypothetical protein